MRTDPALLMNFPTRKRFSKLLSTFCDSSMQSSVETVAEKTLIFNRDIKKTLSFYLNPWGRDYGQLEVLRLLHRAFTSLLDYRYYSLVIIRMERQQHKMSHAHQLVKDLKTSMIASD